MRTASSKRSRDDLSAGIASVVSAAHALAEAGMVSGTAGNVSVRMGKLVAVSATGAQLGRLRDEHVTVVDLEGRVIDGELAPSTELALHLEVYRRYGPGSIVHAHPPVATALACVLHELPCIHPDMMELGGAVQVAPYQRFGSQGFAEVTADALRGRQAALMSNHGTVAIGAGADQAVERTRLLEWAAGVYWRGALIGSPRVLSDEQQQDLRFTIGEIGYGHLRPLS